MERVSAGNREANREGRVLGELGARCVDFMQAALATLSVDKYEQLLANVQTLEAKGPKHRLWSREMFVAVGEARGAEGLLILTQKLREYTGDWGILTNVLRTHFADKMDPFLVGEKLRFCVPLRSHVNSQEATVEGAGGRALVNPYMIYDASAPHQGGVSFLGEEALVSLFGTWGGERGVDRQGRARRAKLTNDALTEYLSQIDLGTVRTDPAQLITAPSERLRQQAKVAVDLKEAVDVRNTEVYRELREAVAAYALMLDQLNYGDLLCQALGGAARARLDDGRQMLGWFESRQGKLPEGIEAAFVTIKDELSDIGDDERRELLRGLVAYYRLHRSVDARPVVAALLSDLQALEALPESDPLHQKFTTLPGAVAKVRPELQRIQERDASLSYAELCKVLGELPAMEIREALNSRVVALYNDDLKRAAEIFAPVFLKDGAFLADAVNAVPKDRLGKSFFLAPIAYETDRLARQADPERRVSVSTMNELAAVRSWFVKHHLAKTDQNRLRVMPHRDFKKTVVAVVVATRKVAFAIDRFNELLPAFTADLSVIPVAEPVVASQRGKGGVVALRGVYAPVEELSGYPRVELNARLRALRQGYGLANPVAEIGLVKKTGPEAKLFEQAAEMARTAVPWAEVSAQFGAIDPYLDNSLVEVRVSPNIWAKLRRDQLSTGPADGFLAPSLAGYIWAIAEAGSDLKMDGVNDSAVAAEIAERLVAISRTTYVDGEIIVSPPREHARGQSTIRCQTEEWIGDKLADRFRTERGDLRWCRLNDLKAQLGTMTADSIDLDTLEEARVAKLSIVVQAMWSAIHRRRLPDNHDLVTALAQLSAACARKPNERRLIVSNRFARLLGGIAERLQR